MFLKQQRQQTFNFVDNLGSNGNAAQIFILNNNQNKNKNDRNKSGKMVVFNLREPSL